MKKGTLRICSVGHRYYKSTDCPTCPVCEKVRKPENGFLSLLVAPARRALESKGIKTLEQLAKHTEVEIASLHAMGPTSIAKLKKFLKAQGLFFRKAS